MTNPRLRLITLAVAGIETLFWLYTFYYIDRHANPLGDGMEWLGEVPLTTIVVTLVVPALILAVIGHWYALATKLAALLAAAALVADVVVWTQLLGEFAHRTAH
jgi:hypothetical protein